MDDHARKSAMRNIFLAQCAGLGASVLFTNNFMLSYLSAIGFSSTGILKLLIVPCVTGMLVMIPAAYFSDIYGLKKIGLIGLAGTVIGFALITMSGGFTGPAGRWAAGGGIFVFGVGASMFGSNWFALLSPIVPEQIRGRFFGWLRVSWQTVSIVLTVLVSVLLKKSTSMKFYQAALLAATIMMAIRAVIYMKIPDLVPRDTGKTGFIQALSSAVSREGFLPFCSYIFIITFCTGACPMVFGLLEKDVLKFSPDMIVMLGTALLLGAVAGYYIGGIMVDKAGIRNVFLSCHLSYGLALFLFSLRELLPFPLAVSAGIITAFFGFIRAASGIAITSELLNLLPAKNKSLSTAFAGTLETVAIALAGFLISRILDTGMLAESWTMFGRQMSRYDTILCGCAAAVVIMTVSLGLVPSVANRQGRIPGDDLGIN